MYNTAWEKVGDQGHYYHQNLVIPNVIRLLDLKSGNKLLDIGCGQAFIADKLPKSVFYQGVDNARNIISKHKIAIGNAEKPLPINTQDFTHATLILSLQNMQHPDLVLKNISNYLIKGGKLVIVLNHPMFRIPRQSSWGTDESKKLQYRRVDRYLSPLEIPVTTHPGQNQAITWSFHHSLSDYSKYLYNAEFVIQLIEEWISNKQSVGKMARMENHAREEFPLFMAIVAIKK